MIKINYLDNPNLFRYSYYKRACFALLSGLGHTNIDRTIFNQSYQKYLGKIDNILKNGLDIGGIAKRITPVNLVYFADGYGWHFVTKKTGEMIEAFNTLHNFKDQQ